MKYEKRLVWVCYIRWIEMKNNNDLIRRCHLDSGSWVKRTKGLIFTALSILVFVQDKAGMHIELNETLKGLKKR